MDCHSKQIISVNDAHTTKHCLKINIFIGQEKHKLEKNTKNLTQTLKNMYKTFLIFRFSFFHSALFWSPSSPPFSSVAEMPSANSWDRPLASTTARWPRGTGSSAITLKLPTNGSLAVPAL